MLGTEELATEVGGWLEKIKGETSATTTPLVVVDPVMISTSGHKLIDDQAKAAMVERVFPHADIVTPNKFEAEELLGRKLTTPEEVEQGAREILAMGPGAVVIKGGHSLSEEQGKGESADECTSLGYAQDFLLMSNESSQEGKPVKDRPRLCDGSRGVWIRNDRYDTIHTHGTGCTLSSAIATAWAIGRRERDGEGQKRGALSSMYLVDACCIAKAYVNAGIARGVQVSMSITVSTSIFLCHPQPGFSVQIGQGPGPVVHTGFPSHSENFPTIVLSNSETAPAFLPMRAHNSDVKTSAVELGSILPIIDTVEWVEKLATTPGVEDIQLRFKDTSDYTVILERIKRAQTLCKENGVRLWINDYWRAAVEAGECFGVHLGQEDMASCADDGGLEEIRSAGLAFGVSTHSYSELAAALGVRPSYISLGPVFATSSKDVKFDPQGLETVRQWRRLIPKDIPLVAIGGISDAEIAKSIRDAGADCSAVIGAVTKAEDVTSSVRNLNKAMR